MNCYSRDELHGFLEGSLIQATEAQIAGHVESCAQCRRALDELSDDQLVRGHMEATRREAAHGQVTSNDANRWQEFTTTGRSSILGDDIQLPVEFGKFVLRETLGAGGFGTVYLADDTELQRKVAVKIPHLGGLSPTIRRRFVREGTATAILRFAARTMSRHFARSSPRSPSPCTGGFHAYLAIYRQFVPVAWKRTRGDDTHQQHSWQST